MGFTAWGLLGFRGEGGKTPQVCSCMDGRGNWVKGSSGLESGNCPKLTQSSFSGGARAWAFPGTGKVLPDLALGLFVLNILCINGVVLSLFRFQNMESWALKLSVCWYLGKKENQFWLFLKLSSCGLKNQTNSNKDMEACCRCFPLVILQVLHISLVAFDVNNLY